ncbi:bifunctional diaminohydroxyphosphoribosylaminopyrimidine deaminase/5-amino-6-(5-phosphoribosylamino)uracil reductase RibD [Myxococcota bacterium]
MAASLELMQRALQEAEKARGRTRPNPLVGCVLARGGEIVAVGHHARAGGPHAELVVLRRAGDAARGADLYVTLEPCNHHGRTGPCTDALIEAGVRRVFVGALDPNPRVNGKGIRRLRRAGLQVEVGILSEACRRLNEAYACFITRVRPFVVAKMAQSLDGRVATRLGHSKWISGERARAVGHQLRNHLDAILVGRGTVSADDPRLTCRARNGRDPIRVVLDTQARTSPDARIIRLARRSRAPTWIAVDSGAPARRRAALESGGAETISCRVSGGRIVIPDLLSRLAEREVMSLLVEGGPSVLGSFFDAGLVDKLHAFVAPMVIGGDGAFSSVGARGVGRLPDAWRLSELDVSQVGDDLMITGYAEQRRPRRKK